VELESERLSAEEGQHAQGHRHLATVHESVGPGRHGAGERDIAAEQGRRFAAQVAEQLQARLNAHAFDSLAILAPPRTLGLLRAALGPKLTDRLAVSEACDCIHEDADQIRRRLRRARGAREAR
jgi:protein required for attachment to host cells